MVTGCPLVSLTFYCTSVLQHDKPCSACAGTQCVEPHRDQRGVAGGAQPPELFPAVTLTLNLLIPPRQDTDAKRWEVVRATGHPQFGSEVTAGTLTGTPADCAAG
jgi:hypothetical protein